MAGIDKTDADLHKQKMKAQQAEQRAKVRERKVADRGLLLVHTGNGKGKSTAGFGTVIRALGWGHKVAIVQYVKGAWRTGEKEFFDRFPELVDMHVMGDGFTWDTQDKAKDIASARAAWEKSCLLMQSGDYDLVMLDELNIVLKYNYLPLEDVLAGIRGRDTRTSVIVTGRNAPAALVEEADLVTDMAQVKHPFDAGIKAKQGLDF